MFDAIRRSWLLTKESYNVLKQDKELMLFPVVSGVVTLIVLASFFVPIALVYNSLNLGNTGEEVMGVILLFLFYFLCYFVIVFFNVGLLYCVDMRFKGNDPTFRDGINAALKNLNRIAQWAFLSGVLGVILAQLEERIGFLGALIRRVLGGAWTIVTFFAVPVMVFEQTGPIEAIKRSGNVIKKTWGESLTAYIGLGAVQGLFVFITFMIVIAAVVVSVVLKTFVIAAVVGGLVVLSWIVFSTLKQIFRGALYVYATTGEVPDAFTADNIREAFKIKS